VRICHELSDEVVVPKVVMSIGLKSGRAAITGTVGASVVPILFELGAIGGDWHPRSAAVSREAVVANSIEPAACIFSLRVAGSFMSISRPWQPRIRKSSQDGIKASQHCNIHAIALTGLESGPAPSCLQHLSPGMLLDNFAFGFSR
jgi:hypothetical protein